MKLKLKRILIITLSITVLTVASIEVGTEIITQYSMYVNGYTDIERHYLADDMGFSVLLMIGLIPEVIFGIVSGYFVGKRVISKIEHM